MSEEIKELTKEVKDMAKSIHELTVSLTGFCAKQDWLTDTIHELKKETANSKEKIYNKLDEQDKRLRDVEVAVGKGSVLDHLTMGKLANTIGWVIALLAVAVSFFKG